jgi:predicted DNA-binding transcriptional regulator AlpA
VNELDDLVTAAEIGRRMGVSRQRVAQLAERDDFPNALGRLGNYVVWRWDDVEQWLVDAGRLPPRRRRRRATAT